MGQPLARLARAVASFRSFSRMGEGRDEGEETKAKPTELAGQLMNNICSAVNQIPLTLILSHPGEETLQDASSHPDKEARSTVSRVFCHE